MRYLDYQLYRKSRRHAHRGIAGIHWSLPAKALECCPICGTFIPEGTDCKHEIIKQLAHEPDDGQPPK